MMHNRTINAHGLYFSISFRKLGILVLWLPLIGFFACVLWAILFHFEGSTATHCKVPNYLPSTSAAIGGFTPEIYIWRICIGLHSAPRFMIAVAYYNFHTSLYTTRNSLYQTLSALASLLHMIENGALVGLTYISSTENHEIHKNFFVSFMLCSLLYMLLTCVLFQWGRSGRPMSVKDSRSYRWKKILFGTNLSSLIAGVYLFYRHNRYCEPGVYSWFALFEYIIIVSNVGFHATAICDFSDVFLFAERPHSVTPLPL